MIQQFAGLKVKNTKDVFNKDTKICMMLYEQAKRGKTTLAASLDALTKKHDGKPSLFIAIEPSDGGGTLSIQDYGVDYIQPTTIAELDRIVAALKTDKTYGGVILDNGSEYIKSFVQPLSLQQSFPGCNTYPTRLIGVPARNDYQIMGEVARIFFNKLVCLTSLPNMEFRKHLIVTALIKERFDDEGTLIRIGPDLPGALADSCTAMFQTVVRINLRKIARPDPDNPSKSISQFMRYLQTKPKGKEIVDDRTRVFPDAYPLTNSKGEPVGLDTIYEEFWLPRLKELDA